ncbi:MAG TPA: sulfurtransferase [Aggregatilineaceae bacterium]|nr:sulfurtransferase [Aggregatilineaceae bacterium]
MSTVTGRGYAHPEMLVSTDWVAAHLNDPTIRFVESNEDPVLYASQHIPGAVEVDWTTDLNHPLRRDYLGKTGFEALMSRIGATPDTLLVFYGDKNNWWATYAFWVFQLFGHRHARIMNGGRFKWEKEGRPMTRERPEYPRTAYVAPERDDEAIRAFREQVLQHVQSHRPLVDVRSPDEYTGRRLHMENYPNEGALRGGHIPGAKNVPWARAVDPENGTFRSADELRAIYEQEQGLQPGDDVIVYCRIGERSSHTWFVLKYLLGYEHVRNYDGSWTEWGNLVNVPIERE